MSRWIDRFPDGTYHEGIADPEECRWLYDEVCCNDRSPIVADWPPEGYCETCEFFEEEEK